MKTDRYVGESFEWEHISGAAIADLSDAISTKIEDPVALRLMTEWSPSPHFYLLDDGQVMILKAPTYDADQGFEDTVAIRVFISGKRLITASIKSVDAVAEVMKRLEGDSSLASSPFFALALIAQRIAIQLRNISIKLVDRLDGLEDDVINPDVDVAMVDLVEFRRTVIMLNRASMPQAEALEELAAETSTMVPEDAREFLTPVVASAKKFNELLVSLRQRSEGVAQALEYGAQQKSEKMSYLLTLAAGVFLPINLAAGMFGVNVGGVPWLDNANGFWILCGLLVLTGVGSAFLSALILKWISRKRLR